MPGVTMVDSKFSFLYFCRVKEYIPDTMDRNRPRGTVFVFTRSPIETEQTQLTVSGGASGVAETFKYFLRGRRYRRVL